MAKKARKAQKARKQTKRARPRKPTAAKVSRGMAKVRPLAGKPAIGRRYEPGYAPPREPSPWLDEGNASS